MNANINVTTGIKKLASHIRFLPLSFNAFISVSFILLLTPIIQVPCPTCGDLETTASQSGLQSLAVQEVESSLIDYTRSHAWCGNVFFSASYQVNFTVENSSSKRLSILLLIKGEMPPNIGRAGLGGSSAKLVNVEIPAQETKIVMEELELWATGGLLMGHKTLEKVTFSIITEPEEIIANCMQCQGTQRVALAEVLLFGKQ